MLVGVFGTSTPYGFWGFSAVRHVMQGLYGDHHHIHCLSIEDLRQGFAARDGKPVVFTSDCPDGEIADLFLNFNAPLIAFLDEPEHAVAFAMESRKLDVRQALSLSTHCFCSLQEILLSRKTVCFPNRHLTDDVRDLFKGLVEVLGGTPHPNVLEDILRRFVSGYRPRRFSTVAEEVEKTFPEAIPPARIFGNLPIEVQSLIMATCDAYRPIFARKRLEQLDWPREVFYSSAENYVVPTIIEFTGPARILTWGPYLFLPSGTWTATIRFEVDHCYSGITLGADVLINIEEVAAGIEMELPVAGIYSFRMRFSHNDPSRRLEIRIFLMRGAIEGQFSLASISLVRETDAGIRLGRIGRLVAA